MSQMKNLVARRFTIGDSAVDGLFAGLGAGIVMAVYFLAAGLIGGEDPTLVLRRFDPSATASPLTGALVHLAVASVYGMLFGVARRFIRPGWLPLWLISLVYSVVLLALAETVVMPSAALSLRAVPFWSFALGHLIYGVTLGFLIGQTNA